MKIQQLNTNRNKIIKLKLIQTKIYDKKQYLNNIRIEDIEFRLKKIFYIIYKYHIFNKRILFIGTPLNLNAEIQNLLTNTKHIFIPKSIWIPGTLSNKKYYYTYLSKNQKNINSKISEILFQLKKNIDLIVILNESSNLDILNEAYISRTPIISINSNLDIHFNKPTYKVPGNFNFIDKKIRDDFFYSILISTLKKGNRKKHSMKYFKTKNK
jgi:ribosomal protein S2